jgi:hypothetical protein
MKYIHNKCLSCTGKIHYYDMGRRVMLGRTNEWEGNYRREGDNGVGECKNRTKETVS